MAVIGRRKIVSQLRAMDLVSPQGIADLVNTTIGTHHLNKSEIDYLVAYYKGVQPILKKEKLIRPEVNNILLANHAKRITRTIVGYFLGNSIQYIQAGSKYKDEIDELNRILAYEDKSAVDMMIGEAQSICGTGYRIIYSDFSPEDDVPFEDKSLDPARTYVVYENDIAERPLAGITYIDLLDGRGQVNGTMFYIYTTDGLWVVESGKDSIEVDKSKFSYFQYNVGGVPIIEYPNNSYRIGDWEFAISVMDAINTLQSGRMDDIEQVVQSLIVFINADIDADKYDEMREAGIVMLKNMTNAQSSVDVIKNPLDQAGMNVFAKELENMLDILVGIPSRDQRGGGGGDTGQAVELRDGWADLEIVARNKELLFKKSEKQTLKIILNILANKLKLKIDIKEVDIKFTRNKNHNLQVKSQSYQTLLATQTISPADALTIVDLVSDVNEYAARGEAYWTVKQEEQRQQQMETMKLQASIKGESSKKAEEPSE